MKRAILDLDGTLLDVRDRNYHSYCRALKTLPGAKPLPNEEYWPLKRSASPWQTILEKSFVDKTAVSDARLKTFIEDFKSSIESPENLLRDVPHQGTTELLKNFVTRGIELTLVTARMDESALDIQLHRLGWKPLFHIVFATKGRKKSEFLKDHFARQNLTLPNYDFWVGDTEEDHQSAKDLGIKCYLVSNGMRDKSFLSRLQTQVSESLDKIQY